MSCCNSIITRIQWNEQDIQEYELERGMHQKIIEPPTPFNFDYHAEDDGMNIMTCCDV